MFRTGNYDSSTLLALFEEDRHWGEYDGYREAPAKARSDPGAVSVMIVRDDKVIWTNIIFSHGMKEFTPQEREWWSAAHFRGSVATVGVSRIEDLIDECTDKATRKALKKQRRTILKQVAKDDRYSWRMYRRDNLAEHREQDSKANNKASSWLRRTSR